MHIYVCICMYVYIYTYMHTHTHTHTHTNTHTHIHTHTRTYIYQLGPQRQQPHELGGVTLKDSSLSKAPQRPHDRAINKSEEEDTCMSYEEEDTCTT
jgi:hypothetical protein